MKILVFLLSILLLPIISNAGKIVVKVSDKIITENEIVDRINVMKFLDQTSNLANIKKDTIYQLALQQLINDKVVLIDAKRSKIDVEDKELSNAIEFIESQIGVQKGKLEQYCKDHGVSYQHLIDHIKAQTALYKIVSIKIRPKVQIDNDSVFKLVTDHKMINFTGILFTLQKDHSNKTMKNLLNHTNICSDIDNFKVENEIKYDRYINKTLAELPKELAMLVVDTKSNNFSHQLKKVDHINIMLVCKKDLNLPIEEQHKLRQIITNSIINQKTEAYMDKLHKDLMVDYKR